MAPIVRPSKKASFAGHVKGPFPGDLLDVQIQNLIDAIHSTQVALSDVRRDDGKIPNAAVGPDQLAAKLRHSRTEVDEIEQKIVETGRLVANTAANFASAARDVDLRAKDAETAAFSVQQTLSQLNQAGIEARDALSDADNAAASAANSAIASQNSANYAKAQSDNAIDANIEATQWAEYLAGPVVNSAEAPAYVAGHPFGHGLYYQPVEGGVAGLWSSKWWALYAQQLVGSWNFYYLGSWATPPVPGSTNPATGTKVATPLSPGSFYYNTTSNQLYIWDGTQWNQPFVQVLTPGIKSRFVYIAASGQTTFSGIDAYGHIPDVNISPSDVYVAGLRKVYSADYTVNAPADSMTLVVPATAGQVVQWDLLSGSDVNVGVNVRKVLIKPVPDGVLTQFSMTYIDSGSIEQAVNVSTGPQLQISLDGIFQEPGVDYVATGNVLTMGTAPLLNSRFWGVWYTPGVADAPPANAPPVNAALPAITGSAAQGSLLTATVGSWTGVPSPTYAFQWKSAGVNVGTNSNNYITVAGDFGKIITVAVTATNSQGSVTATSGNFGPVTVPITGDTTPNPFTFADAPGSAISTYYESNTITVTGIDAAANVSVTNGEYSKNGAVYTSVLTTAVLNDTFKVRGISSAAYSTPVNVVLTIGGVSDTFTITTTTAPALDTTPDPFTFVDTVGAAVATYVVSNTITASGINTNVPISVTGGEYSVNGGAFVSTASTVSPNSSVQVRGMSSAFESTTTSVTLTIGGVSDTFSITTQAGSLLAPTIELTSLSDTGLSFTDNITNDNTPMFDIICNTTPAVGDVLSIYRNGVLAASAILSQSDIDGSTTPGLGTTPVADGAYSYTVTHGRGAVTSAVSAPLSVTIDSIKPVLTSASGIQNASTPGNADIAITTNTGSGVLYWVVTPAAMAAATPYQIINGMGADGLWVAPGFSGNLAVSAAGTKQATASGFGTTGDFKVQWTQTDVAGNDALSVLSGNWTQTIASFTANGVGGFDGTNTYMLNTITPATSIAAGKKGLVSFWLKNLGGSGTRYVFTIATGSTIKFWVFVNVNNAIQVQARNGGGDVLNLQSVGAASPLIPPSPWVHCAMAWDLGAAIGQVYVNGVSNISGSKLLTDLPIGYNQTTASIGANVSGASKLIGSLSELYVNLHETLDLAVPANLYKFRNSAGRPVPLGQTGLLPTGTQPEFYLGDDNTFANWGANNGSKGIFTLAGGVLTDVTGPP